jgi:RNA polymerase sigma-70 factor (ECF subfamily)
MPGADSTADLTLEEIYDRLIHSIYRFLFSKVGNREEAEDLTSQVFAKAVHGLDPSRGFASMQSWLFQVSRTTLADHWRSVYRAPTQSLDQLREHGWDESAVSASAPVEAPAPEERVRALLSRLSPRYREVLICRFLLNLSVRETAERMGISETNAKVLQLRALRRAAELELEQEEDSSNPSTAPSGTPSPRGAPPAPSGRG